MESQLAAIVFYICFVSAISLEGRKSARTGRRIDYRSPVFWPIWMMLGLLLFTGTIFVIEWIVGF